jgi:flagellar motor switch protein FliG
MKNARPPRPVRRSTLPLNGLDKAAAIMNRLRLTESTPLMTALIERDADLAQQVQERMFSFADLERIEDRHMQRLLREVPLERLLLAFYGAPPGVQHKILSNLSARARARFLEDLQARGPVRKHDAKIAQSDILHQARELADAHQIVLNLDPQHWVR